MPSPEDPDNGPTPDNEALQELEAMQEEWARPRLLLDPTNLPMLLGMALALLPFLLGTLYLCWTALWFSLAAVRVDGQVVQVSRDGPPSLLIEYRLPEGRALRVSTDGSGQYEPYGVGDVVPVLYETPGTRSTRGPTCSWSCGCCPCCSVA